MKASEKILFAVMMILGILFLLYVISPRFFASTDMEFPKSYFVPEQMHAIEAAINAYYLNTGRYPKSLDDLLICPRGLEGKWEGPYLKEKQLYDPHGHKYIYQPVGTFNPGSYDIISYGKDGKPGGKGYNADQHN